MLIQHVSGMMVLGERGVKKNLVGINVSITALPQPEPEVVEETIQEVVTEEIQEESNNKWLILAVIALVAIVGVFFLSRRHQ